MNFAGLALALLVAVVPLQGPAGAIGPSSWPMSQFDPAQTGFNPTDVGIDLGDTHTLVKWWSVSAPGLEQIIVSNGIALTVGSAGLLAARNASTGIPLWQAYLGGQVGAPAFVDGRIYAPMDGGSTLGVFDPADGALLWRGVASPAASPAKRRPPVVAGGAVYMVDAEKLIAFSSSACGIPVCPPLWTAPLAGPTSSPAVARGTVYTTGGGTLYAFRAGGCGAAVCAPRWTAATGEEALSAPAARSGRVYASGSRLYAFRAGGCGGRPVCAPVWTGNLPLGLRGGAPALTKTNVHVSNGLAVSTFPLSGCGAASCDPLWVGPVGMTHYPTVYVIEGKVVIEDGPSMNVTVANGVLYVPDGGRFLYAFAAGGCGRGVCAPTARIVDDAAGLDAPPSITGGVLYVPADNSVSAYRPA